VSREPSAINLINLFNLINQMDKLLKFIDHLFLVIIILVGLVHGPALAQERIKDNGDGTVTDGVSGLMWSQADNKTDIYWKDAQPWIRNHWAESIDPKYDNWRLPTVDELQGLYIGSPDYNGYRTACGHRVKMLPQIQISCILLWTSNSALGLPVAYNFNLGNAFTVDVNDNTGCRVLAVRKIR
jgi:hypothetical protein